MSNLISDVIESFDADAAYKLLCSRSSFRDGKWVTFWKKTRPDAGMLGVTNFTDGIFQTTLNLDAQKALLGNVSKNLVADKWRKLFEDGLLIPLETGDANEIEIHFVNATVQLNKTEVEVVARRMIQKLMLEMIDEFIVVSKDHCRFQEHENLGLLKSLIEVRRRSRKTVVPYSRPATSANYPRVRRPFSTRVIRDEPETTIPEIDVVPTLPAAAPVVETLVAPVDELVVEPAEFPIELAATPGDENVVEHVIGSEAIPDAPDHF